MPGNVSVRTAGIRRNGYTNKKGREILPGPEGSFYLDKNLFGSLYSWHFTHSFLAFSGVTRQIWGS
jgi:hypothetical protein